MWGDRVSGGVDTVAHPRRLQGEDDRVISREGHREKERLTCPSEELEINKHPQGKVSADVMRVVGTVRAVD